MNDDENRLVAVYASGVYRTEFVYDGLGRMRKRSEFTWSGSYWSLTATVRYIYDGKRVIYPVR